KVARVNQSNRSHKHHDNSREGYAFLASEWRDDKSIKSGRAPEPFPFQYLMPGRRTVPGQTASSLANRHDAFNAYSSARRRRLCSEATKNSSNTIAHMPR